MELFEKKFMFLTFQSKNVFRKSREITRDIQEVDPNYRDPLRDMIALIAILEDNYLGMIYGNRTQNN
jgi:hypothetical protein